MGTALIESSARPVTPEERAHLLHLIPEIDWIGDETMREQVIAIWVRALRSCHWPDVTAAPFEKHVPAERWNGITHVRTVVRGCRVLAFEMQETHGLPINMDELLAIAILHDAGKIVEIEPTPNGVAVSAVGSVLPHAALVAEWALEAGLAPKIGQAIYAHTPGVSAMPESVEGSILYYVDTCVADVCFLLVGRKRPPKHVRSAG